MPIRTFCDLCDNEIEKDNKRWHFSISSSYSSGDDDEEYSTGRSTTVSVSDGAGRYVERIPIRISHSYVCEKCITEIRTAVYHLTPKYKNTLPTGD